jgi:hypothetical protein
MPDITMAYLPATGAATSASGFNNDVYDPSAAPTSLEDINGWLSSTNRDGAWRVPYNKIRPESMTRAESVGATANQDYFLMQFPSNYLASGAFFPIPGAAKGFYVERASGLLIISASVVIANSIDRNAITDGAKLQFFYKGPSDTNFTAYGSSQQQVCSGDDSTLRRAYFDRQYAFDFLLASPAVGQHEFYIGLWATGLYSALANPHSVRVRCRTMSTFYIP